ncbi:MAG: cytochrome ubiquinol oxidase subunit I [Fimbriimonadaceae bacterium]
MSDPLLWHRIQFAFTVTFHYIFPQLTMGLALLIFNHMWMGYKKGSEKHNDAARFWIKVFGINFAMGVVTGVPMEFQFGTNWALFSEKTGGVIGQTLAMEGIFAFFLESTFLGLLIWGNTSSPPRGHFWTSVALFAGSWLSGYFIITTNAFMQNPVGYSLDADGTFQLASLGQYLLNPWAIIQYFHNQIAALVTGSFVMAAVGAFWTLRKPVR